MQETDLHKEISSSSLYSEDLAPVPSNKRTWGTWNYAALWISMSLCIPTYMLASSLIGGGMNWWQAILTIFVGNVSVMVSCLGDLASNISCIVWFRNGTGHYVPFVLGLEHVCSLPWCGEYKKV